MSLSLLFLIAILAQMMQNSAENALTGFVNAIDPDGTTVTYALTDDAGGRFKIDANTGVLSVANSADLNFEDITSHTVTVKATSTDGSTATQNFTINVSDVNEPVSVPIDSNNAANRILKKQITYLGQVLLLWQSTLMALIILSLTA